MRGLEREEPSSQFLCTHNGVEQPAPVPALTSLSIQEPKWGHDQPRIKDDAHPDSTNRERERESSPIS